MSLECPPGFRNAVFNSGVVKETGWPNKTWHTLVSHNITSWIGFVDMSMAPIEKNMTPEIQDAQIRIVTAPSNVDGALALLKSDAPPTHLELFNEPDLPRGTRKPKTGPFEAAKRLKPILDGHWPQTKLLSPALASSLNETWWHDFNGPDGCDGCMNNTIDIVAGHFYDPDPDHLISRLETFTRLFPEKEIWITELAPATKGTKSHCYLNGEQMKDWMKKVLTAIVTKDTLSSIKKVFWNAGEWSPFFDDLGRCNHSLTKEDGSATDLLEYYAGLCTC